jgi:hypothetical protein
LTRSSARWSKLDGLALELCSSTWRSWTGTLLHEEAIEELGPAITYDQAWPADG